MAITLSAANFYATIAFFALLGIGLLGGFIGGLAKSTKGFFAAVAIVLVSLLLTGLTVEPIQNTALGTAISSPLEKSTAGWGATFTENVYIMRDGEGHPILDDKGNYSYYIKIDGEPVQLESSAGGGIGGKTKGTLAVRLAKRFINEENEGREGSSLAGNAAAMLTTIILDVILFIAFCLVIWLILFVLRRIFRRMHDSSSGTVRLVDRLLGALLTSALALIFLFVVMAIIKAIAGYTTIVGGYMANSPVIGYLYTNNPISQIFTKVLG